MQRATLIKIVQLLAGIIVSIIALWGSLAISIYFDYFALFIITLLLTIPFVIIYFMVERKHLLFSAGLIIGIFIFFIAMYLIFSDRGFH